MTQHQMTLDYKNASPLAHRNDPITSFEAGDKMIKSGKLNRQENLVLSYIKAWCDTVNNFKFTAKDLAYCGIDYYVVQRRLNGLCQKSKIERLNTEGTAYQENKGQELMKRDKCAVWRLK